MEKARFSTVIYAPREKVWRVLWGKDTYPVWTSYFSAGSRAESDWKEGSRILFLNEKNEGMISKIAKMEENQYMSFEHQGFIDPEGREDFDSEMVKEWAGTTENYTLEEGEGKTKLVVELDVEESHKDSFREQFPLALAKIKELAEDKEV